MASRSDKRAQVERYLRQTSKQIGHEEQKRRKGASRARKVNQVSRGTRRQDWSEEDTVDVFEKITRTPKRSGRDQAGPIDPKLPRSIVTAVHKGRIVLEDQRDARLAGRLCADPELRIVVGDEVAWSDNDGVARVEGIVPRRSWLARCDPGNANREIVIAANIDLAVIVAAAADPPLRPGLIDRYLLALEQGDVEAAVCINKVDLIHKREAHLN